MQTFFDRLDAAIAEYSLLKHPFYQAWSAGTLTRETLAIYAAQYYQFEKRFPTFLSAVHSNTENSAHRRQLLLNLMEEEQGDPNHPELWLQFAESVGMSRDEAKNADVFPETQDLIDTLRTTTREGDTLEGVAALYGYESQIPEISRTKIEGLTTHYGVTSEEGLAFFRVHEQADEIHRRAERDLMADLIRSREEEDRAIAAAQRVAIAFYRMLDGIVRQTA
ncbi:MAG TPA: CADD family putative folate metabolism protein [Candidatus Kapabacteria bacterium]|nr:CADD family putative folate metabolism protein [Candidatus Kapabacteria bacterium]